MHTHICIYIFYHYFFQIYLFIGHAVLAVAAAFVISICLEVPFLELDKILLPRT